MEGIFVNPLIRNTIVTLVLCLSVAISTSGQSLQSALDDLGYDIDVKSDEIEGELYFQLQNSSASIIFQESSQAVREAFGWYSPSDTGQWLIGGPDTDLPMQAFLPQIEGAFGFKFHPNFNGEGFIEGVWYSETSLNADGSDHLMVFPTIYDGQVVPYSYVLCWEDLEELGDADFQDMVVRVDWVQAVPRTAIPNGAIAGVVVDDGQPMAGVSVKLYDVEH
ncbi:DUF4114 domain-containing protein, partial [candidate division GN15 bacterium]|nr:DUF4114 domain-containing protein [candidate division GN15 bacterium]